MEDKKQIKKNSFLKDVFTITLLTIFIVLPIRMVIAQPFIVSGSSMVPTFKNGDYLIVDQLTYKLNTPKRFDVIVFRYPNDPSKFFIKRILGLPEETLKSENGIISIQNKDNLGWTILEDSYTNTKIGKEDNFSFILSEGEYYVVGDNRTASSDSRVWGALDKDLIIGRVFVRLFPITQISLFPGSIK